MVMIIPLLAAGIGGAMSLFGGERGNRARAGEASKQRMFSERMRNTQWQSTIADMEAAGINPAVAYSSGPNASPSGSMAQQMDTVSPAVSSAGQSARIAQELKLLKQQTRKASGEAESAGAKGELDQFRTRWMKMIPGADTKSVQPMLRLLEAEVGGAEQRQRKDKLTGDIMGPMAGLSERVGELLPILMMLSTMSPGGAMRGISRKAAGAGAKFRAGSLLRRQKSVLRRSGG